MGVVAGEPSYGSLSGTAPNLTYSPSTNFFGNDSFTFIVNDGNLNSDVTVVSLSVNPVNNAPLAYDDSFSVLGNTVHNLDVLNNDIDPENDPLIITIVTDPPHGSTAIVTSNRQYYISYQPDTNYFGTDAFTYIISDGQYTSTASVSINVLDPTGSIDAVDDYVTVDEDITDYIIDVLNNDLPSSSVLQIIYASQPLHGTTVVRYGTEHAKIEYTPDADYFGPDFFLYFIQDQRTDIDTATVYITVTNINDPPTAEEFYVQTYQNTPINAIDMLAHASDPDGDELALDTPGLTDPPHGTATRVNDSTASYSPDAGFMGIDYFNYTITDGTATATSTVWVFVMDSSYSNVDPVAVTDAFTVDSNSTNNQLDVLDNDFDLDDDTLTIVFSPAKPENGTVVTEDNYVYYTPDPNYFGTDSFTYVITDGHGGMAETVVTITVSAIIDTDSVDAIDDSVYVLEDSTDNLIKVMKNDLNPDNLPLTIAIVNIPSNGTAIVEDKKVNYTPAQNYFGTDCFTYALMYNQTALDTATVKVNILSINHRPDAVDDYYDDIPLNTRVTIEVLLNDSDLDGNPFNIVAVTQPMHGTAAFTDTIVTYTPAQDYFGNDYFTYTIHDCYGAADTATVSVTVVNSPPPEPDPEEPNLTIGDNTLSLSDLDVYNPLGPQVSFGRIYSAKMAMNGESSVGLSPGWRHTYDYEIIAQNGGPKATLRYPDGSKDELSIKHGVWTHPSSAPYRVLGNKVELNWYTITLKWNDGEQWIFYATASQPNRMVLGQIKDRLGHAIFLNHNKDNHRLESIVDDQDPAQDLLQVSYNDNHNGELFAVMDGHGILDINWYQMLQDPELTDPWMIIHNLRFAGYAFDDDDNLQLVVLNGEVIGEVYAYSEVSGTMLISSIQLPPDGNTYSIEYDPDNGFISKVTDPNGYYDEYSYRFDNDNRVLRKTITTYTFADHDNPLETITIYYDRRGRISGMSDNARNTATLNYTNDTSFAQVKTFTDFDGRKARFTYDQYGNMLSAANSTITTTYNYDYETFPLGRVTQVSQSNDTDTLTITEFDYDDDGLIAEVRTPRPGTNTENDFVSTTITYNDQGDVTHVSAPGQAGGTLDMSLSYAGGRGLVSSFTMGTGGLTLSTQFTSDAEQGTVRTVTLPGGYETKYLRNMNQQATLVKRPLDPNDNTAERYRYVYNGGPLAGVDSYGEDDSEGTPSKSIDIERGTALEVIGSVTTEGETEKRLTLNRDGLYRITQLRDHLNRATNYTYHATNLLPATVTYPGGDKESYSNYDKVGRLGKLEVRAGEGQSVEKTVTWTYQTGGEGLLTEIDRPGTDSDVSLDYDDWGRLASVTDGAGTHSFGYSLYGSLFSVTTTYGELDAKTLEYAYNDAGGRKSVTLPDGRKITPTYDSLGRLTRADLGEENETPDRSVTYQYSSDGRISRRELMANNAVIAATTYSYDLRGKMSALRHYRRENGQDVLLSEFTDILYDSQDRIIEYAGNVGGLNGGALDWSGDYAFTYTEHGELESESLNTGGGTPDHSYTLSYTYDGAGNRLTGGFDYNDNNQLDLEDYVYNASGNPVEYDGIDLEFNADDRLSEYGAALTCGYRGDGLRAWKDSGAGRTYYLYDGETLLAELDAAGALTDVNLWGAGELACRGDTFYLYDPLGNVVHRLDTTGTVLDSEIYDAWGNLLVAVEPDGDPYDAGDDPYGYKGQFGYFTDRETNLILCSHRFYDPALGRWLTRDPKGIEGGINLYQYCGNDPLNHIDPRGLSWTDDDDSWMDNPNLHLGNGYGYMGASSPFTSGAIDEFQDRISAVGNIPIAGDIVDGLNALLYLARRQYGNAALSGAAMIPLAGSLFRTSKFRNGLALITRIDPIWAHAHHMFPRKFTKKFFKIGIDVAIPVYGAWWGRISHLRRAREYNLLWESFFDLRKKRTVAEAIAFARHLAVEYGLDLTHWSHYGIF